MDGQRACGGHNDCCFSAAGCVRVFDLPVFPLCAASRPAHARHLFQVKREPIEERFVPELRILRLKNPVSFIGENHELGRDLLALKRIEKFQ
jgi:hypothetical protein